VGLFLLANGASLTKHEKTINRVVDGEYQRKYIVIFNDKAPNFGDKETVVAWSAKFGISAEAVYHYYAIGNLFQGFSAFMADRSLQQILDQSIVKYVEEDEFVSLDFTRKPQSTMAVTKVPANPAWRGRFDWGQYRVNARAWHLNTLPGGLFRSAPPATYGTPYPVNGSNSWNWNAPKYDLPNEGQNAVVWIVDTGVYDRHDEFQEVVNGQPRTRVDEKVNFVTTSGDTGVEDRNGHGTHCAGTAAGNYRGLASKARIRSVRVLGANGSGSWDGVIAGVNYIANRQIPGFSNILSASLGGGAYLPVDEAVNAAVTIGVIAVIAAGNSNNNCCGTNGIGGNSPARAELAVTVAASSSDDVIASFSSYGPCTNSIAPGVTVTSAWIPSGTATDTDLYNDISGTSMATPHVAGAIAILTTTYPAPPNPDQVKADLSQDQTPNIVGGLTGVKATTPNLFLYSQWKQA